MRSVLACLMAVTCGDALQALPALRARSRPLRSAPAAANGDVVIGIDVGTGSARAGVFSLCGAALGTSTRVITTWEYRDDFVEQSSQDIWQAVCAATRQALSESGCAAESVKAVAFDATCSLVVVDGGDEPVSVTAAGEPRETGDCVRNVIVWMDHRATPQAAFINGLGHRALRTVGGTISPEMEMPKVLWLKEELPSQFAKAAKLFDLPDWLSYRATGDATRSLCSMVCKWNLQADDSSAGWDESFLEALGLTEDWQRLDVGSQFGAPGDRLGGGLTTAAAAELGLCAGTAVAVGMIDAHAGGLGCVGGSLEEEGDDAPSLGARLAIIAGTSACHMASCSSPLEVPGVWGPYYGAMVPGAYLHEGGQTAAGQLLDFCVGGAFYSAAAHELAESSEKCGESKYAVLNGLLDSQAARRGFGDVAYLARDVHVDPDFFGNRAPLADPTRRGGVVGLRLSENTQDLAALYLAAVQALAYQTRHIAETLTDAGHEPFLRISLTGGLAKNPLFVKTLADALGVPVALPRETEAVLLGAAVLAATAARAYDGVASAMQGMTATNKLVRPDPCPKLRKFHDAKYAAFRALQQAQTEANRLMANAE